MSLGQRLWSSWKRLWLGQADARRLALYRLAWGLAALIIAATDGPRAGDYAPNRFHVPLSSLAAPIWPETHEILRYVALGGALLALTGVLARVGIAAATAVYAYLLSVDLLMFRNHVYLLCLLGLILACSPCDRRLSLLRRAPDSESELAPRWPEQLIKAQILTVYAWAVVAKLNPSFLAGVVLSSDLAATLPDSPLGALLQGPLIGLYPLVLGGLGHAGAMAALSWFVLLSEAALLVGLCIPRLRRAAVIVGLVLHAGIALAMNVFAFALLMVGSYVFFWPRSAAVARKTRTA
jgi:hypothetical protein